MSGFWFRLTRLAAEFGAVWRHHSVYGLDLVPGNRRALWPSPWRSVRSIRIIPVTSITYGRDQILQGRKRPVFRRVSLRIGWKAPSLRRIGDLAPWPGGRGQSAGDWMEQSAAPDRCTGSAPRCKSSSRRSPGPFRISEGYPILAHRLGDSSPLSPHLVVDSDSRTKS